VRSIFVRLSHVNFVKSTIFKSKIIKGATDGLNEFAAQWLDIVPKELLKQSPRLSNQKPVKALKEPEPEHSMVQYLMT